MEVPINIKIIGGTKYISLPELISFLQKQLIVVLQDKNEDKDARLQLKGITTAIDALITAVEEVNNR